MRKRSSYKPKPVIPNILEHIVMGNLPVTVAAETITRIKIANHGAMERLLKGKGTGAARMSQKVILPVSS